MDAKGAIFLVDPDAIGGILEAIGSSFGVNVRFLTTDVSNLWRLQAQNGVFLDAQLPIEQLYPFDRIIFPQTNLPLPFEERLIYPDRQSHLEQQIAIYRKIVERQEGLRRLWEPEDGKPGPLHVVWEGSPLSAEALELHQGAFDPIWTDGPNEQWSKIVGASAADVPTLALDAIIADVSGLTRVIATRRHALDLLRLEVDESTKNGSLQGALDVFSTGCRPYPYESAQIAAGLVEVVRLCRGIGDFPLDRGLDVGRMAKLILEDVIEIEFATDGGACSRAHVAAKNLWVTLTPQARMRLNIETAPNAHVLMNALDTAQGAVRALYDPKKLIDLFVRHILPWQVAAQRGLILFSPTHISTLGRP